MSRCWFSGPFLVAFLVAGQALMGQSTRVRQRAALLPSGASAAGHQDLVDSYGFREFILRAGNDRVVDFPNGGPEATIAQIIPANLMKGRRRRRRRMADIASQRAAVGRERSLSVGAEEYHLEASSQDDGGHRQAEPTKLGTASIEVLPSQTTMTFPIRGLPRATSATIAVVDLYPIARPPFPVVCRGAGTVVLGEMTAVDQLDPTGQPKIYTADVTACLRAASEAGLDDVRIEMAMPCRQRCLLAEPPFLVFQ